VDKRDRDRSEKDERTVFVSSVRDALNHLSERAYLETHPLATISWGGQGGPGVSLRRALLDAIEALRPARSEAGASLADVPAKPMDPAWRRYRLLVLRYVEGKTFEETLRDLNVSARQAYRDHAQALQDVAGLLWEQRERMARRIENAEDAHDDESAIDEDRLSSELARFGGSEESDGASLDSAIRSALETVDVLARERDASFDISLPSDLPPTSIGRTVLRQIMLRLFVAMIDLINRPRVTVNAATRSPRLIARISAQCQGATWAAVDRARGEASLEVGRRLLTMHGGALAVAPLVAGHLEITVTLPAALAPTVLVIDDNPDFGRLVSLYLAGRGCRVQHATNAEAALRFAQATPRPAVITLDVLMPSADGWEILRELRARPETRQIPIVVCSVLPDNDLARSFGVAGFLAKPISRAKLLTALDPFLPPFHETEGEPPDPPSPVAWPPPR
jgi:CheY-like chemotaxis protein